MTIAAVTLPAIVGFTAVIGFSLWQDHRRSERIAEWYAARERDMAARQEWDAAAALSVLRMSGVLDEEGDARIIAQSDAPVEEVDSAIADLLILDAGCALPRKEAA